MNTSVRESLSHKSRQTQESHLRRLYYKVRRGAEQDLYADIERATVERLAPKEAEQAKEATEE